VVCIPSYPDFHFLRPTCKSSSLHAKLSEFPTTIWPLNSISLSLGLILFKYVLLFQSPFSCVSQWLWISQIVQNLYAIGRQAQAVGFNGPILGKKFTMTREEQIRLEEQKALVKQKIAEAKAAYESVLRITSVCGFTY
jgi:hypothetical protein